MLGPGAPTGPGVVGGGKVSAALMVGRNVNARRHDVRKLVKARTFFLSMRKILGRYFPHVKMSLASVQAPLKPLQTLIQRLVDPS